MLGCSGNGASTGVLGVSTKAPQGVARADTRNTTEYRRSGASARAVLYRDLLQRIVITPRIQQNMVTAQDQFAIDTW
jgi:hypothetical protein